MYPKEFSGIMSQNYVFAKLSPILHLHAQRKNSSFTIFWSIFPKGKNFRTLLTVQKLVKPTLFKKMIIGDVLGQKTIEKKSD